MSRHDDHDDFGGLLRDLHLTGAAMDRRRALRLAARFGMSLGALPLLGCGDDGMANGFTNPETSGNCTRIPEETAGPFPGDGSNGPNVLNQTGAVRSDIRSSFGGLTGTADGVPLSIVLTLVSAASCAPLVNRAIYVWHCDKLGRYSLYSDGVRNQNYLRGVQLTNTDGKVTFTSIFPACYAGRWPHIHFEVFASPTSATNASNKIAASQIALPKATCDLVYATPGYEQSIANLSQVTLASDSVFRDGSALELASVTGSVAAGFVAALRVAV